MHFKQYCEIWASWKASNGFSIWFVPSELLLLKIGPSPNDSSVNNVDTEVESVDVIVLVPELLIDVVIVVVIVLACVVVNDDVTVVVWDDDIDDVAELVTEEVCEVDRVDVNVDVAVDDWLDVALEICVVVKDEVCVEVTVEVTLVVAVEVSKRW